MALVWLTGVPGVGKTAVALALRRLGVWAVDVDGDGFRAWQDRNIGEWVEDPGVGLRPPDWSERVWLPMVRSRVEDLRIAARGTVVVLAGHVPNEGDCLELFDVVVALRVDDETLTRRLIDRPGRSFGKTSEVREAVLSWNAASEAKYRAMGALIIDATRPLTVIAEEVAAARKPLV